MLIVEGTMEDKFMKEILNKMVEKENKIQKNVSLSLFGLQYLNFFFLAVFLQYLHLFNREFY